MNNIIFRSIAVFHILLIGGYNSIDLLEIDLDIQNTNCIYTARVSSEDNFLKEILYLSEKDSIVTWNFFNTEGRIESSINYKYLSFGNPDNSTIGQIDTLFYKYDTVDHFKDITRLSHNKLDTVFITYSMNDNSFKIIDNNSMSLEMVVKLDDHKRITSVEYIKDSVLLEQEEFEYLYDSNGKVYGRRILKDGEKSMELIKRKKNSNPEVSIQFVNDKIAEKSIFYKERTFEFFEANLKLQKTLFDSNEIPAKQYKYVFN